MHTPKAHKTDNPARRGPAACPASCPQNGRSGTPDAGWWFRQPAEFAAPQCGMPLTEEDGFLCAGTGLSPRLLRELRALACRYNLERLILFGSRARGDFHRASDIDLAAEGGNVSLFALDVDELTHTPLRYDVVDLGRLYDTRLLADIAAQGKVLYEETGSVQGKSDGSCAGL